MGTIVAGCLVGGSIRPRVTNNLDASFVKAGRPDTLGSYVHEAHAPNGLDKSSRTD